jgi:hypothetical protein
MSWGILAFHRLPPGLSHKPACAHQPTRYQSSSFTSPAGRSTCNKRCIHGVPLNEGNKCVDSITAALLTLLRQRCSALCVTVCFNATAQSCAQQIAAQLVLRCSVYKSMNASWQHRFGSQLACVSLQSVRFALSGREPGLPNSKAFCSQHVSNALQRCLVTRRSSYGSAEGPRLQPCSRRKPIQRSEHR